MPAPKKRLFGTISRLSSGKYRARYTGPDGKKYSGPHPFFTKDDAGAWLRQEQKLIEFDEWQPPHLRYRTKEDDARTVGDWLRQWLDLQEKRLKPSTMVNYRTTLDRRILTITGKAGRLRTIPLVRLTRRDVIDWWDALTIQFGYQPYNRAAYVRLRTAIQAAVDRDLIPTNPVDVKEARHKPKPARKELPEAATMQKIVDNLNPTHKIIGILTFFHGMRIGEVLGLRRKDITITGDTILIHIRGNAYRTSDGMKYQDTPKTSASHRTIPVFKKFHQDIIEHLATIGDSPDAFICTTGSGKIILDTSYRSVLHRAKTRAGITERISPHYGRVWLITTLVEQGMTIPAIGELLGQVDLKTITEIYMRTSNARRQEALQRVSDSLMGS
ncbi:tyrosine-type recombinase/integrase [Corynebacterium matruchotii]|uniref:Site-specific recombinase, phage integrase family n=1 Tax=Corynebacterium matruchotii ATCC 33806 TaxID=566549 RepID=C0E224_9CORY|nr:tyrosine-type recombinase/integrase [Corynebacterium matruchotii]EEG27366.1 site-specific recombinase, phage integrase family [Corynebacterium matruchotii ATCC 33806]